VLPFEGHFLYKTPKCLYEGIREGQWATR